MIKVWHLITDVY